MSNWQWDSKLKCFAKDLPNRYFWTSNFYVLSITSDRFIIAKSTSSCTLFIQCSREFRNISRNSIIFTSKDSNMVCFCCGCKCFEICWSCKALNNKYEFWKTNSFFYHQPFKLQNNLNFGICMQNETSYCILNFL